MRLVTSAAADALAVRRLPNYIEWHLQPDESSKIHFLRDFAQLCLAERQAVAGNAGCSPESLGHDAGAADSTASDVQSVDDIADAILADSSRPGGLEEEKWNLVVHRGREIAKSKKAARIAQCSKGFGYGALKVKK